MGNILDFYKGKRIFLTGHTGFKGSWMCRMLANAGAIVTILVFTTDCYSISCM